VSGRAAALGALLCCACGHQPPWVDPSSTWYTVSSEGFSVHSDGDPGSLAAVVAHGVRLRDAVAATFFAGDALPEVEAIMFDSVDDYEGVAGQTGPHVVRGVGRTGAVLVARARDDQRSLDEVLAHELAHRFASKRYPRLPVWLDEGLALYLSTIELRGASLVVGAPPPRQLEDLRGLSAVAIEPLLEANEGLHFPYGLEHYDAAWALVHYLLSVEGEHRFTELLGGLATAPDDAEPTLQALYPGRDLTQLGNAAFAWVMSLRTPGPAGVRVIPLAEVPHRRPSFSPAGRGEIRSLCQALREARARRHHR
jgi:hypothetical protein